MFAFVFEYKLYRTILNIYVIYHKVFLFLLCLCVLIISQLKHIRLNPMHTIFVMDNSEINKKCSCPLSFEPFTNSDYSVFNYTYVILTFQH